MLINKSLLREVSKLWNWIQSPRESRMRKINNRLEEKLEGWVAWQGLVGGVEACVEHSDHHL
jgi:hypothetical protein